MAIYSVQHTKTLSSNLSFGVSSKLTNSITLNFPGDFSSSSNDLKGITPLSLLSIDISFSCTSGSWDSRQKLYLELLDNNDNVIAKSNKQYFQWYKNTNDLGAKGTASPAPFNFSFNNLNPQDVESFRIKITYDGEEYGTKTSVYIGSSKPITVVRRYLDTHKVAYLNEPDSSGKIWNNWQLTDQYKYPNETLTLHPASTNPSLNAVSPLASTTSSTRFYLHSYVKNMIVFHRQVSGSPTSSLQFSHWIDQYGNRFNPGDIYSQEENLFLTPVTNTLTQSKKIGFILPNIARQGYILEGWYTQANGGGTKVGKPGDYFDNSDNTVSQSSDQYNLYANWVEAFTVTYTLSNNLSTDQSLSGPLPFAETVNKGAEHTIKNCSVQKISNETGTFTVQYNKNTNSNDTSIWATRTVNWTKKSNFSHWQYSSTTKSPGEKITINANTTLGAVFSEGIKVANSAVAFPSNPTRTGYKFQGWATSRSGSPVSSYTPTQDTVLYAIWTANTYTVTFNANGGSVSPTTKIVTYGNTYSTLPEPSRTGYSFDGWYTEASGGTKITSSSTVNITANQTLFAHWTARSYTVTFDANGGSVGTASKSVTYGSTYGTLPTPNKTDYTFNGWYTATSGGTKITSSTEVSTANNHTLYAQWIQENYIYTIKFDANGGTGNLPSEMTASGPNGSVMMRDFINGANAPSRTGYNFRGWSSTKDYSNKRIAWTNSSSHGGSADYNGVSALPTGEWTYDTYCENTGYTGTDRTLILYAQWELKRYTISYNGNPQNGGTVTNLPASQTKEHGSTLTLRSTKPNHSTITKTFSAYFMKNAGDTTTLSGTVLGSKEDTYTFDKWNLSAGGSSTSYSPGSSYTADESATLYAQWTHSVSDAIVDAPSSEPTRDGYKFSGWGSTSSATSALTFPRKITQNTYFYAIWKRTTEPSYTVHYDLNGGYGTTPESVQQKVGESFTLPSFEGIFKSQKKTKTYTVTLNPNGGSVQNTKVQIYDTTRYTPFQWNTDPAGKGANAKPGDVRTSTSEGEYTFYVIWNETTYGGQAELPTPTREGYEFTGWKNSETGTIVSSGYSPAGNDTLIAQWELSQARLFRYNSQNKLEKVKVWWYESENSPPIPIKKVYYYHNNSWKDVTEDNSLITE